MTKKQREQPTGGAGSPSRQDSAEERGRSRTETAYLEIGDRLADLRFAPGSRFTEAEVAEELKMSKTPVREALLMHVVHELVVPRPGSGYVVAPITVKDVRGLFRHWRGLACEAAGLAASSGLDAHISLHLDEALESLPALDAYIEVFSAIFSLADDRFLAREYMIMSIEVRRLLRLVLSADEPALSSHLERILAALGANDATRARSLVEEQINELERVVMGELLSGKFLAGANLAAATT